MVISEATRKHYGFCICGDFNAEVGSNVLAGDAEDFRTLGAFGLARANSRGERLKHWCQNHELAISNTHFDSEVDSLWTFTNGGVCKMLDYFLLPRRMLVSFCGVLQDVDVG